MITVASYLRHSALKIFADSNTDYYSSELKNKFGLSSELDKGVTGGPFILRQICNIFNPIPPELVKDCGIKSLLIRSDMGPNKPYYPNHGYFVGNQVALNADIFHNPDQPDDFFDHRGYFITRPQQTLTHEFGHGYDSYHSDLSLQPKWLKLSGWNPTHQDGLKRIHIKEPGAPEVIGEWFYDPKSEFTRFYAKRNPWDDWADSFAFYTAGMRNKLPKNKESYFDDLLKKYY